MILRKDIPEPNPFGLLEYLVKNGKKMTDFLDVTSGIIREGRRALEKTAFGEKMAELHGFAIAIIGDELLVHEVRDIIDPEEREDRCMENAYEKAVRLGEFTETVSSYETREEANRKYGGGVRADLVPLRVAISSFPELVDEAFCIRICERLGWMSEERREAILAVHGDRRAYNALVAGGF